MVFNSPSMCDNRYKVLLTRGDYTSLGVYENVSMENPHDLDYSVSSQGQNDVAWLRTPGKQKQAFTINHIFSIDYLIWFKVSNIQRYCQAGCSKGSEVISQKLLKV